MFSVWYSNFYDKDVLLNDSVLLDGNLNQWGM